MRLIGLAFGKLFADMETGAGKLNVNSATGGLKVMILVSAVGLSVANADADIQPSKPSKYALVSLEPRPACSLDLLSCC